MILKKAYSPRWANENNTCIDLTIVWKEFDRELPFTASADDFEEHGRLLFKMALNKEFGEIAPFTPNALCS